MGETLEEEEAQHDGLLTPTLSLSLSLTLTPTLTLTLTVALILTVPLTLTTEPSPTPGTHQAQHFGQRVSFLKYDSEAARGRKGSPPPRLLRGFGGDEDLPSLSRFITASLAATDGFMTTEFPKVAVASSPHPNPKLSTHPNTLTNPKPKPKPRPEPSTNPDPSTNPSPSPSPNPSTNPKPRPNPSL